MTIDDIFDRSNEGEGLYDKYRVYFADELDSIVTEAGWDDGEPPLHKAQVPGFVFVLRPDHDYHARVALAAYMESVRGFNPTLAEDIGGALDLLDVPKMMIPD